MLHLNRQCSMKNIPFYVIIILGRMSLKLPTKYLRFQNMKCSIKCDNLLCFRFRFAYFIWLNNLLYGRSLKLSYDVLWRDTTLYLKIRNSKPCKTLKEDCKIWWSVRYWRFNEIFHNFFNYLQSAIERQVHLKFTMWHRESCKYFQNEV